MKKLLIVLALVSLMLTTVAHAAPDYQGLADIYNSMSSDRLQVECRYNEGSNAFNMRLIYPMAYEVLMEVFEQDQSIKDDLMSVFEGIGQNIRESLDSVGSTDVSTLVIAFSKDMSPIYINHNGTDVAWLIEE